MSITPFKGASYTQEIVLQTAAQWEGTPDFYLQAYQVGKESDTGLAKSGPGLWGDLSYLAPKVYRALLTQTGTDAPVATVLENTLGPLVWTRYDAGKYIATLAGAFPSAAKVWVPTPTWVSTSTDGIQWVYISLVTVDSIQLETGSNFSDRTSPSDPDSTIAYSVEILVYPS